MVPDETDATGRTNGYDPFPEPTSAETESEHCIFPDTTDLVAWFSETIETE
ncbi:hypothetical protein [Halocatena marina]|uniref:hypothetical protein n=1 Tax=Halocatena marina TaxID=2934937 RepID=UPI00200F96AD|nr:hypothetical protein [Halocatena marina]